MKTDTAKKGILVYCLAVLLLMLAVVMIMRLAGIELGSGIGPVIIIAAMWVPALARIIAVRTVDRGWKAPLPLRRWGSPRAAVILVPLGFVLGIYAAAYALAWIFGAEQEAPVWSGAGSIAVNVAMNFIVGTLLGVIGAMGEELGWRGYMQPRLDQAGVRGSLLIVIVVETLFHIPIIVLAGYLGGDSAAVTIALFFGLKLGATPLWTWCTYRFGSIWLAAWFHSIHNTLSQGIFPKVFGAGSEQVLGESGVLPVAIYIVVAVTVFLASHRCGTSWGSLKNVVKTFNPSPSGRGPG